MNDLVAFLTARLDEDEAYANEPGDWNEYNPGDPADPARVLREVEAKRRIIERAEFVDNHGPAIGHVRALDMTMAASSALGDVLQMLALPYADHPDYREAWRI